MTDVSTERADGGLRAAGVQTLGLLGGKVALDFANTIDPRNGDHAREFLGDYGDLVQWALRAADLTREEADVLLALAARRPGDAAAVFGRAIELREAIYRVFSATARRQQPAPEDLETLARANATAAEHSTLVPARGGFTTSWRGEPSLDRPLWPVARSAVEVLTSGDLRRVKECPGADGCSWLFYDTSRNVTRRWCSMAGCGSRSKMRRQYARKKQSASAVQ